MDLLGNRGAAEPSLFDDLAQESKQAVQRAAVTGDGVARAKWNGLRRRRLKLSALTLVVMLIIAVVWIAYPPAADWTTNRVIVTYFIMSILLCIQVVACLLITYQHRLLLDVIVGLCWVGMVADVCAQSIAMNQRLNLRSLLVTAAFVYIYPTELELPYHLWTASAVCTAVMLSLSVEINVGGTKLDRALLIGFAALFTLLTYLPQRFLNRLQKQQQGFLATLAAESRSQLVLLKRVIPDVFIEQLLNRKVMTSHPIDNVTVLFCEVVVINVDPVTGEKKASKLGANVQESTLTVLSAVFHILDRVVARNQVYKVETIFSEFVAVSGLPRARSHHVNTAYAMVTTAIDMLREVRWELSNGRLATLAQGMDISLQIGVNTGAVVESILGRRLLPRWKLFGDTVNTASRMKSNGVYGRIHCSRSTRDLLMRDAVAIAATALDGTRIPADDADALIDNLHHAVLSSKKVRRGSIVVLAEQHKLQQQQSDSASASPDGAHAGSVLDYSASSSGPGAAAAALAAGQQLPEPVLDSDILFGRSTGFFLRPRPPMQIKGKGIMCTYLIELCAADAMAPALDRMRRRSDAAAMAATYASPGVGSVLSQQMNVRPVDIESDMLALGIGSGNATNAGGRGSHGAIVAVPEADGGRDSTNAMTPSHTVNVSRVENDSSVSPTAALGRPTFLASPTAAQRANNAGRQFEVNLGVKDPERPQFHPTDPLVLSIECTQWMEQHDKHWTGTTRQEALLRRFSRRIPRRWSGTGLAIGHYARPTTTTDSIGATLSPNNAHGKSGQYHHRQYSNGSDGAGVGSSAIDAATGVLSSRTEGDGHGMISPSNGNIPSHLRSDHAAAGVHGNSAFPFPAPSESSDKSIGQAIRLDPSSRSFQRDGSNRSALVRMSRASDDDEPLSGGFDDGDEDNGVGGLGGNFLLAAGAELSGANAATTNLADRFMSLALAQAFQKPAQQSMSQHPAGGVPNNPPGGHPATPSLPSAGQATPGGTGMLGFPVSSAAGPVTFHQQKQQAGGRFGSAATNAHAGAPSTTGARLMMASPAQQLMCTHQSGSSVAVVGRPQPASGAVGAAGVGRSLNKLRGYATDGPSPGSPSKPQPGAGSLAARVGSPHHPSAPLVISSPHARRSSISQRNPQPHAHVNDGITRTSNETTVSAAASASASAAGSADYEAQQHRNRQLVSENDRNRGSDDHHHHRHHHQPANSVISDGGISPLAAGSTLHNRSAFGDRLAMAYLPGGTSLETHEGRGDDSRAISAASAGSAAPASMMTPNGPGRLNLDLHSPAFTHDDDGSFAFTPADTPFILDKTGNDYDEDDDDDGRDRGRRRGHHHHDESALSIPGTVDSPPAQVVIPGRRASGSLPLPAHAFDATDTDGGHNKQHHRQGMMTNARNSTKSIYTVGTVHELSSPAMAAAVGAGALPVLSLDADDANGAAPNAGAAANERRNGGNALPPAVLAHQLSVALRHRRGSASSADDSSSAAGTVLATLLPITEGGHTSPPASGLSVQVSAHGDTITPFGTGSSAAHLPLAASPRRSSFVLSKGDSNGHDVLAIQLHEQRDSSARKHRPEILSPLQQLLKQGPVIVRESRDSNRSISAPALAAARGEMQPMSGPQQQQQQQQHPVGLAIDIGQASRGAQQPVTPMPTPYETDSASPNNSGSKPPSATAASSAARKGRGVVASIPFLGAAGEALGKSLARLAFGNANGANRAGRNVRSSTVGRQPPLRATTALESPMGASILGVSMLTSGSHGLAAGLVKGDGGDSQEFGSIANSPLRLQIPRDLWVQENRERSTSATSAGTRQATTSLPASGLNTPSTALHDGDAAMHAGAGHGPAALVTRGGGGHEFNVKMSPHMSSIMMNMTPHSGQSHLDLGALQTSQLRIANEALPPPIDPTSPASDGAGAVSAQAVDVGTGTNIGVIARGPSSTGIALVGQAPQSARRQSNANLTKAISIKEPNNSGGSSSNNSSSTNASQNDSVIAPELNPYTLQFVRSQAGLEAAFVANHINQFKFGAWSALLISAFVAVTSFAMMARFEPRQAAMAITGHTLCICFLFFLALLFGLVRPQKEEGGDLVQGKAVPVMAVTPRRRRGDRCRKLGDRWKKLWTQNARAHLYSWLVESMVLSVLVGMDLVLFSAMRGAEHMILDWQHSWGGNDGAPEGLDHASHEAYDLANGIVDTGEPDFAFIFGSAAFVLTLMAPYYCGLLFRYHTGLAVASLIVLIPALAVCQPPEWISGIAWIIVMNVASTYNVRRTELRLRASFLDHQLVKEQQARTKRMLHAMLPEKIAEQMMKRESGDGNNGGEGGSQPSPTSPENDPTYHHAFSRIKRTMEHPFALYVRALVSGAVDAVAKIACQYILGFDWPRKPSAAASSKWLAFVRSFFCASCRRGRRRGSGDDGFSQPDAFAQGGSGPHPLSAEAADAEGQLQHVNSSTGSIERTSQPEESIATAPAPPMDESKIVDMSGYGSGERLGIMVPPTLSLGGSKRSATDNDARGSFGNDSSSAATAPRRAFNTSLLNSTRPANASGMLSASTVNLHSATVAGQSASSIVSGGRQSPLLNGSASSGSAAASSSFVRPVATRTDNYVPPPARLMSMMSSDEEEITGGLHSPTGVDGGGGSGSAERGDDNGSQVSDFSRAGGEGGRQGRGRESTIGTGGSGGSPSPSQRSLVSGSTYALLHRARTFVKRISDMAMGRNMSALSIAHSGGALTPKASSMGLSIGAPFGSRPKMGIDSATSAHGRFSVTSMRSAIPGGAAGAGGGGGDNSPDDGGLGSLVSLLGSPTAGAVGGLPGAAGATPTTLSIRSLKGLSASLGLGALAAGAVGMTPGAVGSGGFSRLTGASKRDTGSSASASASASSAALLARRESIITNAAGPGSASSFHQEAAYRRAQTYEVSLLLFDLVGFTSLSADVGPRAVVELLDRMYASFDRIVSRRGARKIETIGDAFLVACGVPEPVDMITSASIVAKCALDMLRAVESFSTAWAGQLKGHKLQARIGIHCGRVLAGVIGDQMPRYQLFGTAVDECQALESSSEPGQVHASPELLNYLTMMVPLERPPSVDPSGPCSCLPCCAGDDIESGSGFAKARREQQQMGRIVTSKRAIPSLNSPAKVAPADGSGSISTPTRFGGKGRSGSRFGKVNDASNSNVVVDLTNLLSSAAAGSGGGNADGNAGAAAAGTVPGAAAQAAEGGDMPLSPSAGSVLSNLSVISATAPVAPGSSGHKQGTQVGPLTRRTAGGTAYLQKAIPDIKVTKRKGDGTGFIARDRAGGMVRGVAW